MPDTQQQQAARAKTEKQVDDAERAATEAAANAFEAAHEKGYLGHVPDETPNEAYSLKSGPDGVAETTDPNTRVAQATFPTKE